MSKPERLTIGIAEARSTRYVPRYGLTRDGYTKRSGAPTSTMIRLEGEKRWRRLMVWCWSNIGTCFIRLNGKPVIVPHSMIPEAKSYED